MHERSRVPEPVTIVKTSDVYSLRSHVLFVTLLVVYRTEDRGTLYACTADRRRMHGA